MARSLALAAFLALGVIAVVERGLRSAGMAPYTANDADLWCRERDRLNGMGRDSVALLGSSRVQQGFSLATFRKRHPGRQVVQLAIAGGRPFPVLEEVAKNTRFAGLLICEVQLSSISRLDASPDLARSWLEHYHREWSWNRCLNFRLREAVRSRVLATTPGLGPAGVAQALLTGRVAVNRSTLAPDRQFLLDFSGRSPAGLEAAQQAWCATLREEHARFARADYDEWARDGRVIGELVRKIESRGGRVVFVVFPISGKIKSESLRLAPRERYWEPLLRLTGARGVDCTLLPEFRGFHCPDGSHLDLDSAAEFTDTLCAELEEQGAL